MTARHFALLVTTLAGLAATAAAASATSSNLAWRADAHAAFDAARASGRPLLVDLYAEWCGWCRTLEARVFSTPLFAEYARDFVLLRVDVEDGGEGSELAARYGAGGSLPTMLVLEPRGALVGAVVGYHPAPEFVAELRATFAAHARGVAAYEAALRSRDAGEVLRLAGELHRRLDGDRAAALYARALELEAPAPDARGDELAWLRWSRADALRLARRFDEAQAEAVLAARAGAGTADPRLAERLELLPFWIARDAERCADAAEALAGFAERHPRSSLLPGARVALERLRGADVRARCS
jgi:thiol-disulfide isomerase/thioredoxin